MLDAVVTIALVRNDGQTRVQSHLFPFVEGSLASSNKAIADTHFGGKSFLVCEPLSWIHLLWRVVLTGGLSAFLLC